MRAVPRLCLSTTDRYVLYLLATDIRLRNRLNLLLGHATASRGDNRRSLQMMDLATYTRGGDGLKILLLYYKKTKTTSARMTGAARHSDVLLCPVGALAFYLFHRLVVRVSPSCWVTVVVNGTSCYLIAFTVDGLSWKSMGHLVVVDRSP